MSINFIYKFKRLYLFLNSNSKIMKKNYILFLLTVLFAWVGHAQTTLTQSVDPVNVTDGGVACWSSGT
ncbi:MAG TPA: hypothetical protein DCE27_04565, partial [Xanthomarina gelatinilytica]|nr:hypothetical protein [Xanthomarina gelatinilytica]